MVDIKFYIMIFFFCKSLRYYLSLILIMGNPCKIHRNFQRFQRNCQRISRYRVIVKIESRFALWYYTDDIYFFKTAFRKECKFSLCIGYSAGYIITYGNINSHAGFIICNQGAGIFRVLIFFGERKGIVLHRSTVLFAVFLHQCCFYSECSTALKEQVTVACCGGNHTERAAAAGNRYFYCMTCFRISCTV